MWKRIYELYCAANTKYNKTSFFFRQIYFFLATPTAFSFYSIHPVIWFWLFLFLSYPLLSTPNAPIFSPEYFFTFFLSLEINCFNSQVHSDFSLFSIRSKFQVCSRYLTVLELASILSVLLQSSRQKHGWSLLYSVQLGILYANHVVCDTIALRMLWCLGDSK